MLYKGMGIIFQIVIGILVIIMMASKKILTKISTIPIIPTVIPIMSTTIIIQIIQSIRTIIQTLQLITRITI